MRKIVAVVALLFFLLRPAEAATKWKKVWKFSAAVLGAANAADVHSSWGGYEGNPLLRGPDGRFGARGTAIKGGIITGIVVFEYLVTRKKGAEAKEKVFKALAITNFALTGVFGGAAARNYQLR